MPLQTTPLTEIPFNLDGTIDRTTWGESGGPFSVPAEEGPGLGGVTLASNTVNYEWQHPARHLRGIEDRLVQSTQGLFTNCVVSQGVWNTGGGTLNITLAATRLVVDFAQDGGAVLELIAAPGSPEVLPALSDSYVDITDVGVVTVVSVGNGLPPPGLTANSVRFYKLVTDAAQLTAATLEPGLLAVPCLGPSVGIADAQVGSITVGTLTVQGTTTCEDLTVDGNTILGDAAGDTLTVNATATFAGPFTVTPVINATAGIQAAPATPIDFPEGATVPNGGDIGLGTNATITGGTTTAVTVGELDLIDDSGVALIGEARFYTGSPGFGAGRLMFDGKALTLGNGTAAPRISRPVISHVPGPVSTGAAILDTGASVSLSMVNTEKALVIMTFAIQNDTAGENIKAEIWAGAGSIGPTNPIDEPQGGGNSMLYMTRTEVYTAVATASITFKARFGAAVGNTTIESVSITASHIQ